MDKWIYANYARQKQTVIKILVLNTKDTLRKKSQMHQATLTCWQNY
jgi:hypothetical protein